MNALALKLIGVVVALSVAFGAGFYTESQFVKADQLKASNAVVKEAAASITESLNQSIAIENKVKASNIKVNAIEKTVVAHVEQVEKANETICSPGALRLDLFTVGMLNAAREEVVEPSTIGYAEGAAASTIGFPELVQDELEITKLYKELATRHDALVDYLQGELENQK